MGGTDSMRLAGETFLPKEKGEEQESYDSRLARTTLLEAFKRTLQKLVGEVFTKDIVVNDETNADLKAFIDDVDLDGKNLSRFAANFLFWALALGIGHVLIDAPKADMTTGEDGKKMIKRPDNGDVVPFTLEVQKEIGLRPY